MNDDQNPIQAKAFKRMGKKFELKKFLKSQEWFFNDMYGYILTSFIKSKSRIRHAKVMERVAGVYFISMMNLK